ncbi:MULTISPECIES: DUF6397 family protein [Streptomyces]|uniref:DNA-binding protein n=1 Tax=Streptomyces spororaveus TaxID=284039 RepID=A0ABQ3TMS7_9ACTN|nr:MULTISPECIES: DUF6397 family protein [Streptomyces]MCM9077934.1 DUF6397 family protein [Streptomyces spororaveus]MCX5307585.1 DUF6397 family protein [Streptomyces sp. NBC_00160]GHI81711.1 hypothetical protein Sspor_72720 [Streptomyces spororaveus]
MTQVGTALREDAAGAVAVDVLLGGVQAAGELGLSRHEFARAVQLGIVRAGPRTIGGAARFARAELDRVRSAAGPPGALRERVETVAGAQAAAEVVGVGPSRFTRLARCGHVIPVGYRINRYRAVVWLYLTTELRSFAAREPGMLSGIAPSADRELMAAGADLRPRKWRGRHVGLLLGRAADPWERAAVLASVLPEAELLETVPDPAERIVLAALGPPPPYGHPQVPAAAAVATELLKAGPPDEIHWYRASLDFALVQARGQSKSTGERGPT